MRKIEYFVILEKMDFVSRGVDDCNKQYGGEETFNFRLEKTGSRRVNYADRVNSKYLPLLMQTSRLFN